MSYEIYKLIHLGGLMLLFLGLGAATMTGGEKPKGMMMHGIGILLMLVGGFGMLARLEMKFPWEGYIFGKVGIWVVLAILPILVRKKKLPAFVALLVALALGVGAAYLAIKKPF